jgi:hypothetical protein
MVTMSQKSSVLQPAKSVSQALTPESHAGPEESTRTQLLADIREVFEVSEKKEISSEALVAALGAMHDRPWGECNRGKALTQSWLARWLRPFGVHPKNVGPKYDRAKGYTLESFADVFKRYIPPIQPSTCTLPMKSTA